MIHSSVLILGRLASNLLTLPCSLTLCHKGVLPKNRSTHTRTEAYIALQHCPNRSISHNAAAPALNLGVQIRQHRGTNKKPTAYYLAHYYYYYYNIALAFVSFI